MNLSAAQPFTMRVIKQSADGSGVVEIPILTVGEIDLALTSGGGDGIWKVTPEILKQMAANFEVYPGPVPVGFNGHVSDRSGPSPAFVDKLMVQGNALVAHVFVTPEFFAQVKNGYWRGFSFEGAANAQLPSRFIDGWFVSGGTFTNQPAADVHFRLPDTIAAERAVTVVLGGDNYEGTKMANEDVATKAAQTVSLSFHEREMSTLKEQVAAKAVELDSVRAELSGRDATIRQLQKERDEANMGVQAAKDIAATAKVKAERLEAENRALRDNRDSLQQSLDNATAELRRVEASALGSTMEGVITQAIDSGVQPRFFDGWKHDPATWLKSRFVSLDAFKEHVEALMATASGKVVKLSDVKSGHDPKAASGSGGGLDQLPEDQKRLLSSFGEVDFTGVTTEAEAKKRWLAHQRAKADQKG